VRKEQVAVLKETEQAHWQWQEVGKQRDTYN
jgi:hypothetical protein